LGQRDSDRIGRPGFLAHATSTEYRSGPDVELLREVGGQGEGGVEVWHEAAMLQRFHDKAGADLVVATHPAKRPSEQKMQTRTDHVQVAESLAHLREGVYDRALPGLRAKLLAKANDVVFIVAVPGEGAAPHAVAFRLDQRAVAIDQERRVAPVRVGGVGTLEAPFLSLPDKYRHQVVPEGQ